MKNILPLIFVVLLSTQLVADIREQYAGLDTLSTPAAQEPVTIKTSLVEHGAQDKGQTHAVLIIEATIQPGWKFYDFSQPDGAAMPARVEITFPTAKLHHDARPTNPPKVEHDKVFDAPIHYFYDKATWLIPVILDETNLQCRFTGLACNDGIGGVCVPLDFAIDVELVTDQESQNKLAALLASADKVPKNFWYDTSERNKTETPTVQPTEQSNTAPSGNLDFLTNVKPRDLEQIDGIAVALLYALLGGLILNVMPCVLPVIGLKILSFFEQAGKSRSHAFLLNLAYVAGLLSVFLLLAAMSVGLSKLFTVSIFSIVMCAVVFAMSLSLMGIWELSAPAFLGRGESVKLMSKEGFGGAFFKGIITTLLAIPCGAPLLSPAISWSDQQIRSGQTTLVFLVYATIGIGMGLPYLIIGAFPELLRFLPKPGEWMETFRKTMGFALLIAVVWILYFIELTKIVPMITLLFAIWYACWSIGRLDITTRITQRLTVWMTSLAVVVVVTLFAFNIPFIKMPVTLENAMQRRLENWAGLRTEGHWASYSHKRFEQELIENKRTVLIDFTADWCANCKFLEATVLESKEVIEAVENKKIVTFRADCTRANQEGTQLLRRLGAESVPTMAIFRPENPTEPQIIRGNYHAATLLQQLE